MAVAYDAASKATTVTGVQSSISWTFTTVGSSNLGLVVGVVLGISPDTGKSVTGVTANGISMTQIGSAVHSNAGTAGFITLWGLANNQVPAAQGFTVQASFTSGTYNSCIAGGVSFTGVDQSTPFSNSTSQASTGDPPSLSVTSSTGNMTVDVVCNGQSITSTNQTQRWLENHDTNTAAGNAAMSTGNGAASVGMDWTVTSDWYAQLACNVNAAAGDVGNNSLPTQGAGIYQNIIAHGYWS